MVNRMIKYLEPIRETHYSIVNDTAQEIARLPNTEEIIAKINEIITWINIFERREIAHENFNQEGCI